MSYQDWRTEPAWYIDLLLDHLDAEEETVPGDQRRLFCWTPGHPCGVAVRYGTTRR
jgi:hypothetical protein